MTLFGMSPDPWVGLAFFVIAGPDIGNMRGGLVADATSGAALVSGGLLCLGAVAVVGATTAALRSSSAPIPPLTASAGP